MAPVAIGFGVVLAALGLLFYFPEQRSVTALIPSFFGAALVLLGLLGYRESWRKHVMHLAAMLGLVGLVLPAYRVLKAGDLPRYLAGESVAHPAAVLEQTLMAVICFAFTALCVNSFIEARRARRQQESGVR